MEIRFDRDLRHNYMVLCGLNTKAGDYRLKMLKENTPEGLLNCSIRSINGVDYLYYEIDSLQPLKNRYAAGSMSSEELVRLLNSLLALSASLTDYLLDIDHVLFSADCIYVDMRTGNYYFTYCPSSDGDDTPCSFRDFAETLLELINQDDESAVLIAYSLCDMAESGGMMITDMAGAALSAVGTADESQPSEESATPAYAVTNGLNETRDWSEAETTGAASHIDINEGTVSGVEHDYAEILAAMDEEEKPPKAKKKRSALVMMLLFAAVFAANLYIRRFYYLNSQENLLSLSVAILSLAMTVISLVLTLRDSDKTKTGETDKREGKPQAFIKPQLEDAALVGEFPHPRETGGLRPETPSVRTSVSLYNHASGEDEETTVLSSPAANSSGISKLYGRNGDSTVNITLEKLPMTIGKLTGAADYIIRDPSISRLHARFLGDATGRATQIKDLNSTNGTWLNGRRLKPNETADIRPGDEIGLGSLLFEFR